jgi:3-oxoacyl-(acyl-carrier-protein) synthase
MTLAIDRAGRRREEIGYVNFHGTSTLLNDAVESRCVRQLFGAHTGSARGSSVKSMIGHPQGASGAAGVVTAALALSRGFLPPTINQREPIRTAISTSFRIRARAASRARRCATASGSDPRTARSSSAAA